MARVGSGTASGEHERWSKLESLIDVLVEMPVESRPSFLDGACGDDVELREEIEELLGFYAGADPVLDHAFTHSFSALMTDARAPVRELMDGAYHLEREIGRGGMATVYLAVDKRHDRKVAAKILHGSLSPGMSAERFLAEIRTMARLRHPHILPLHDSGESDGILFYVMPYVENGTLRQRLQANSPIAIPEALRIVRDVASAIEFAHRHGVVHRDIKPENILLDDDSFALVADFGIALAVTMATTDGGISARPAGTPRYMSPEQSRGDAAIDGRSDIYSLAAVAYEMLAGRPLRVDDAPTTSTSNEVFSFGPELTKAWPAIPAKVNAALTRALAPKPEERHRTATEFAADLERAFSPSRPSRFLFSAGVAIVLVVLTAILISIPRFASARSHSAAVVKSSTSPRLSRYLRAANVAAYDSYQRGLDQALSRSDSGARLAIRYFEYAISQDSGFAPAYAELAHMYTISAMGRSPTATYRATALARAVASAAKAVSLDDSLPEAHDELAFARMLGAYDLPAAEFELKRALALDPAGRRAHEYLGDIYMWTERPTDALREIQIAAKEDPLAISSRISLAYALYMAGKYDRALVELQKLRRVNPPIRRVSGILGGIHVMRKMYPEAIQDFRGPNNHADALPDALFARTLALSGNRREARRILPRLIASSGRGEGAYAVAVVYEGLGDYDNAFAWLNKSIDDHSIWISIMSPMFETFRADPRFDRIRKRLGFPAHETRRQPA